MEIIIGLLFVIIYIVYNFTKDTKEKNAEMLSQGGIKQKYKKLISQFDHFDIHNPPTVLNNDVNFYQIGWAGATTLMSISFFEVFDKIFIEFEQNYNFEALKRNGVDIKNLPNIHKKEKWGYNNSLNQIDISRMVAREIEILLN